MGKRSREEEARKSNGGKKRSRVADNAGDSSLESKEEGATMKHTNLEKEKKRIPTVSNSIDKRNEGGANPPFFRRRVQLAMSLLPSSLRNCQQAVENSIRKKLLRYCDGFGGVLMAYDDVELRDKADGNNQVQGWILNELPYIHYNVYCQVLVFAPYVGCVLQGVVNECFPSHVGLLVLDYINAMVSADTIRDAGFLFDHDLRTWTKEEGSVTISGGNKVNFVVSKVHECDGTVSLEGVKISRSLLVES